MAPRTVAVTKAVGGAGATRTALELATTLARDGRSVAVLDVDFATQGLAATVPGPIEDDITAVLTEQASLEDATVEVGADLDGSVAVAPARAPFERLARAKTQAAARGLEDLLAGAAGHFDRVLVDVPPVTTNPAVAAVTSVDRVAAVTVASERGVDALQQLRERLADVDAAPGIALANRADDDHPVDGADVALPTHEVTQTSLPATADPDPTYAPAVAAAAETLFDVELELTFPEEGVLAGRFG